MIQATSLMLTKTGLYWRLLPDKMHAVAGEVCTGGKKSEERVTVLVSANMTGSEKLPLLTSSRNRGVFEE